MKAWFQRFMSGRYGFDQLNGFLCILSLILVVLGAWLSGFLYWVGLAMLLWCYYRMLSRNIQKRYAENTKYLSLQNQAKDWLARQKLRFDQRKVYRYFKCPHCRQSIRVPRGRGRISITCPKCGTSFIKKS